MEKCVYLSSGMNTVPTSRVLKYAADGPLAHARGSVITLESTVLLPSRDREGVVGGLF
ncbi:MAG: hypothetical protein JWO48_576, partial [Bryobacterales bacterium]|nr:hypothetical protein [Bryobacterales bacterium]